MIIVPLIAGKRRASRAEKLSALNPLVAVVVVNLLLSLFLPCCNDPPFPNDQNPRK